MGWWWWTKGTKQRSGQTFSKRCWMLQPLIGHWRLKILLINYQWILNRSPLMKFRKSSIFISWSKVGCGWRSSYRHQKPDQQCHNCILQAFGIAHSSTEIWTLSAKCTLCCTTVRRGDWRERSLKDLKCSTCHVAEECSEFDDGQRCLMLRSSDAVNNEQLLRWLRSEDGDILVTALVARIRSLILVLAGQQKEAGTEVDLKRHGEGQSWSSTKVSVSSHGRSPVRLRKIGTDERISRGRFWRNIPPGILHLK